MFIPLSTIEELFLNTDLSVGSSFFQDFKCLTAPSCVCDLCYVLSFLQVRCFNLFCVAITEYLSVGNSLRNFIVLEARKSTSDVQVSGEGLWLKGKEGKVRAGHVSF